METVPGALRSAVLLAVFLHCRSPVSGQEVPPVDGDPNLLLAIRDAQHANEGKYPYGEVEVIAEMGQRGKPLPDCRVEALVRWDKDQQRLVGTSSYPSRDGSILSKKPLDLIYRGNRSISYNAEARTLTISDVSKWGYIMLTRLRPQDWWYGKINGDEPSMAERLDAMLRLPPDVLRHIRVHRTGEDRVEISRTGGMPGSFHEVYSLADEGNRVSYESAGDTHEEKRDYTWARDTRNRCYLKSCHIERHFRAGQGRHEGTMYYDYEVTRFDADKRPAKSIFADSAIKLPPGTSVDDRITGRRDKVGDRPVDDVRASLDRLVPELKSRGFAAAAREE